MGETKDDPYIIDAERECSELRKRTERQSKDIVELCRWISDHSMDTVKAGRRADLWRNWFIAMAVLVAVETTLLIGFAVEMSR